MVMTGREGAGDGGERRRKWGIERYLDGVEGAVRMQLERKERCVALGKAQSRLRDRESIEGEGRTRARLSFLDCIEMLRNR